MQELIERLKALLDDLERHPDQNHGHITIRGMHDVILAMEDRTAVLNTTCAAIGEPALVRLLERVS